MSCPNRAGHHKQRTIQMRDDAELRFVKVWIGLRMAGAIAKKGTTFCKI